MEGEVVLAVFTSDDMIEGFKENLLMYGAVLQERHRQEALHPGQTAACAINPYRKLAILVEEVGEVATALMDTRGTVGQYAWQHLRDELVQVAAVSFAWVESLDRAFPGNDFRPDLEEAS